MIRYSKREFEERLASPKIVVSARDITFQLNQYHGMAIHNLPAAKSGLQQLVDMLNEKEILATTFDGLRKENKSAYDWVMNDLYRCFQKGVFNI